MRHDQDHICRLVKEILGDDAIELRIERVRDEEDLLRGVARVAADLYDLRTEARETITGEGVGHVDAFFHALLDRFGPEYPSLQTIQFSSFKVGANLNTKREGAGTDSVGEVTLTIRNSEGRDFEFEDASRSLSASTVRAVLKAVTYFVNSERAFIACRRALQDAKQRGRTDLVEVYAGRLIELLKNTSYSEAIERAKAEA